MSKFRFGKPYMHNNWYIFPETTLNNLQLDDCVSSVTGKCENTNTVEDCVKICEKSQNCFAGYFINTPDNKNICVPINKLKGGPSIGPYYRLRNQNIYPELDGMKSYVFTSGEYKFPPEHANCIFYMDKFVLSSVLGGKSIGTANGDKNIILSDNPVFIQFLPEEVQRSYVSQYLIVKNGDIVSISIPNTSYLLRNAGDNISWVMRLTSLEASDSEFRVFTTNKNKKIGDFLDYGDDLYFTNQNQVVIYDASSGLLRVSSQNEDEKSMAFKITPKVNVYYCDKECKSVLLENTQMEGTKATYNGIIITRNPFCWGKCDNNKHAKLWLISIPIILVFVVVLVLILRK